MQTIILIFAGVLVQTDSLISFPRQPRGREKRLLIFD
jgi:hypothetical protein